MSQAAVDKLKARFGDAVLATSNLRGDDTVVVDRKVIVEVARFLKDDPELRFNMLIDLFGVDYQGFPEPRPERFEVIYHFLAIGNAARRVRVKVLVPEAECKVDSITSVWPGADWYERECWDMFGVRFDGHPNLKRLLMYEAFEGHPLRKDYAYDKRQPLVGTPH